MLLTTIKYFYFAVCIEGYVLLENICTLKPYRGSDYMLENTDTKIASINAVILEANYTLLPYKEIQLCLSPFPSHICPKNANRNVFK